MALLSAQQRMGAAALILAASTVLSRLMGLARDKIISWQFGAGGESDMYFAAFVVPDIINYLLAGGFMSITIIPLLTRRFQEDEADGWNFFSCVFCWMTAASTLLTIGGSLAGTLVTAEQTIARQFISGAARAHGRIQILNEESSKESTGHGSPLPQLVHGGPGRAGGGEELGGLRAVKHYLQRTAIQGSPTMLAAIGKQWVRGAAVQEDRVHPFRKYFEELQPGDSLLTPRRTLTEADIVNFACLSGDHFYAHMDKIGAAESIFGERVVHGYFLISAAAGLFVDAGVGPVIANYGMENLRFIEPVKPGDTIQVRLTCKRKTLKKQRSAEEKPTGVVEWAVEIFNQHQQAVALYSILTLVARQQGDFPA